MKKLLVLAAALLMGISPVWSQTAKKSLTVDDLVSWQRISAQAISNDGQWVACKMEPWKGDAAVYLYDKKGNEVFRFNNAGSFAFSGSSYYILVEQQPSVQECEALQLKKTPQAKMPMNSLILHRLGSNRMETLDSIRSYRVSASGQWLACQQGRKDKALVLRTLCGQQKRSFADVVKFDFAPKSDMLYFMTKEKGSQKLYRLDPNNGTPELIKEGKGKFSQITLDDQGNSLAFLYCNEEKTAYKSTSLWLSQNGEPAHEIAAAGHEALPEGWVVSQWGSLRFSKSASRLFFGTSPEPKQTDTTILAENRPNVQVWSWDEPVQYTVQQYNKSRDLKKSYTAVYDMAGNSIRQLSTLDMPSISLPKDGEGQWAIASNDKPYSLSFMWEGRSKSDYYKVNMDTGASEKIATADYAYMLLSPAGKYAYGYAETDSCWFTVNLANGQRHQLTDPKTFVCWDELDDHPDYPGPYGSAGWSSNDEHIYIYDRYDIWQFDPEGQSAPVRMTLNGRENSISYRTVKLDPDARFLDTEHLLLKGTNQITKGDGYYSCSLDKPACPKELIAGDFMLSTIAKAKNADRIIFTKETYEMYPDIHYTNLAFKKPVQLTHGGAQEEGFIWGTAELVSWTSMDGEKLEGVVYKPADFDPNRKYPMIVNFYETNSEKFFKYKMPEAHRSTVDYRLYNSNGYIVFNPDMRYKDGHPGESCYRCLMPALDMMIATGYIDENALAAQGHSWGGYQVAYLATRTNRFAAIESGAPVVNMFSAYGGIRWGSGMARSFQYEHTQSRLGTNPWDGPEIYKENSPLFTMDKVKTPILIMHNDHDGHVPWYQGIEYFVAMKRLGKPCWLLNYTGEVHWPQRLANKVDFQKRMFQFFGHYLKGEPMPKWMKDGIPAVEQPYDLGY